MGTPKRIAGLVTVLCTLAYVAGCSNSVPAATTSTTTATISTTAATTAATTKSATTAPVHYDLARLALVRDDFPADYLLNGGRLRQVTAGDVDEVGYTVSDGKSLTVDPPECRPLLLPVTGTVGADSIGISGDGPGTVEQKITVQADDGVTVPAGIPTSGCDRMSFETSEGFPGGTAERLAAPDVEGADTFAVKILYGPDVAHPDYFYTALLDDRVQVRVQARMPSTVDVAPLLSGLLVKAVAAISSSGPVPTTTEVADGIDVHALASMKDPFPAGFPTVPLFPDLSQHRSVPFVGTVVSFGLPFTVDPERCRPLLKPVDGHAGARTISGRSDRPDHQSVIIAAEEPVVPVAAIPDTGCDRMTYRVDYDRNDIRTGTVERIAAPRIDGAVTYAVKATVERDSRLVYRYVAILDGYAYVYVGGQLDPDSTYAAALPDLLVRAVDVVRGR